jgi:hypothetical protein
VDFSQEHAADLTALPSPQQIFSVELGHPDAWIHPVAFRQVVQPDPVGDEPAPDAGLAHDRLGAAARGLQPFHQPKPRELGGAPFLGDAGVVLEHLGALTTDRRGSRRRASAGGHRRGVLRHDEESTLAAQFLLHGPAQIEHQMKPIRDLPRLGCAAAHGVGVRAVAIAADDLDAGMAASQAATASAVRTARTSTTRRRSRSTRIVPKCCCPFCQAQSSMPSTRSVGSGVAAGAPRLTRATMVSAPMVIPSRANRRSPARPPKA